MGNAIIVECKFLQNEVLTNILYVLVMERGLKFSVAVVRHVRSRSRERRVRSHDRGSRKRSGSGVAREKSPPMLVAENPQVFPPLPPDELVVPPPPFLLLPVEVWMRVLRWLLMM